MRAEYMAKKKKGIRGAVYRHAEEHNVYYSLECSKSIFYNDDKCVSSLGMKVKHETSVTQSITKQRYRTPAVRTT